MDLIPHNSKINFKNQSTKDYNNVGENTLNLLQEERISSLDDNNSCILSPKISDSTNDDEPSFSLNENTQTRLLVHISNYQDQRPKYGEQGQINQNDPQIFEYNGLETNQPISLCNSGTILPKIDETTILPYMQNFSSPQSEKSTSHSFSNTHSCKTKSSPSSTPQKEIYSDRFIPFRHESVVKRLFEMPEENEFSQSEELFHDKKKNSIKYQRLLEDGVLGVKDSCLSASYGVINSNLTNQMINKPNYILNKIVASADEAEDKAIITQNDLAFKPKLFKFKYSNNECGSNDMGLNTSLTSRILPFTMDSFTSPISKNIRKIPDKPFKILEAPNLEDDFYLNLIDWSSSNILGVALHSSIYLWSPSTCLVQKLCQSKNPSTLYTSISWNTRGDLIALGNSTGRIEIWDAVKMKILRDDMESHKNRIGCINWSHSGHIATGSRDKNILIRDLRVKGQESTIYKYIGHKQEVCGLKWSPNDKQIASGGNDNKIYIWSIHKPAYEAKLSEHTAAVKALAWSPHQNGLLVSGGGNNDKSIKFWNTLTYKCIKSKYTDSQVCNLIFSKNSNEFVSTHGFLNNQVIIWKYPELSKVAILEGHSTRVLYLTISPDGETIVTGAGDETLRFWNVFPPRNSCSISPLLPSSLDLRQETLEYLLRYQIMII